MSGRESCISSVTKSEKNAYKPNLEWTQTVSTNYPTPEEVKSCGGDPKKLEMLMEFRQVASQVDRKVISTHNYHPLPR